MSFVVLQTFSSRNEAESVQAVLAGSGIESLVESDDCGAVDPALGFGRGVQLLVAEEDADRAADVMSQVVPPEREE